jgi:hypothetical protein
VTETDALDRPWRVTIPSGVRGLDETIVKHFEGDDWMQETRTLLSGDPASCELTTRAEAATRYRDERGRISDVVERSDGRRVHFEFDARGRVVAEHRSFVDDDAQPSSPGSAMTHSTGASRPSTRTPTWKSPATTPAAMCSRR